MSIKDIDIFPVFRKLKVLTDSVDASVVSNEGLKILNDPDKLKDLNEAINSYKSSFDNDNPNHQKFITLKYELSD
jgi:hypothetical protein